MVKLLDAAAHKFAPSLLFAFQNLTFYLSGVEGKESLKQQA